MRNCLLAVVAFLCLFMGLRHTQPAGILLYQGMGLGLVVTALQIGLARWKQKQSVGLVLKDGLLSYLLIYVFVFTIPTTVDRAYSVKMINHLAAASDGLTREEIAHLYVADFVQHGGVDKRLQEQGATGTLYIHEGRYRLTRLGSALAKSFRLTQQLFACGEFAK